MPSIYLSPSTQDWNMYVTGSGSEEYNMNRLADALEPYLLSNGIQYRRNRPEMTAGSSIREANQNYYDLYLALHSNAAPEGRYGEIRGIIAFYYPGSAEGQRAAELMAEALRQIYPQFNWQQEVQKGEFARLIAAGIDARTAYEVTHREELLRRAMAYAAARSAAQSARTVQSSRRRVSEAGTRSAVVSRADPKSLSSAQLSEIRRRVMDGEKIRF